MAWGQRTRGAATWGFAAPRRARLFATLAVALGALLIACGPTVESVAGTSWTSEGGQGGGGAGTGGGAAAAGGQGGTSCAGDPVACDDANPCTDDLCDLDSGACDHSALDGVPAPAAAQATGDCQLLHCVDGAILAANDDEDLPDDGQECTLDLCQDGQGTNPPLAAATPCTQDGGTVCDDGGDCVECNLPSDCLQLPPDDPCQTRTCTNDLCGQWFTPQGSPLPMQQPADCKVSVCDGSGASLSQPDDTDLPNDNNDCTDDVCTNGVPTNPALPPDDGNECTAEACSNGTPVHPPEPANTPCAQNGGTACDGAGTCV
jgi:hypothetical protein